MKADYPMLAAALLVAASVPLVAAAPDAPALSPKPRTYANACAPCHDGGGFGVVVLRDRVGADRSLLHKRTDLSAGLVRIAVRNGIGAMPAMSKLEVSDRELDGIITELTGRAPQ